MKCLFINGVKSVVTEERPVPDIGEKDVLIKLEARGICGTDLTSYRYGMPNGFGHEMAGVVAQAGKDCNFKVGD